MLRTALGFIRERLHFLRVEQSALRGIVDDIGRWIDEGQECDLEALIARRCEVSEMWNYFDWEPLYDERDEFLAAKRAETLDGNILTLIYACQASEKASDDPREARQFAAAVCGLANSWVDVEGNPFVDTDDEVETWARLSRDFSAVMIAACPFVKNRLVGELNQSGAHVKPKA